MFNVKEDSNHKVLNSETAVTYTFLTIVHHQSLFKVYRFLPLTIHLCS